jgi:hypothetical protein
MKKFFTLSLFIFIINSSFGQATLPSLFNVSSGTYALTGWDSLAAAGTSPLDMRFEYTIEPESASGNGYDSSAEGAANYNCPYNLTSRNRILGLNAGGFAFQATSSAQYNDCAGTVTTADSDHYVGVAVLGLNTTGKTNVGVKWVGTAVKIGDGNGDTTVRRQYATRLQYRVGISGKYIDVTNNGVPVQFSSINGLGSATVSATLPASCNNQAAVYIRWVYFQIQVGSGTRPELAVDDIQVGSNLLPVDLLSFNAVAGAAGTSLAWQTANEVNFSHFDVEKSYDASAYTSIGQVAGKNNGAASNYSFEDDKVITGNAFYRLKLVDKDGSFSYSGVIRVSSKITTALLVYPNPVATNLVLMHTQASANATLAIIGFDGKRQAQYNVAPNAIQTSVNVSRLTKGSYVAVYFDGKKTQTIKFIKQ